MKKIEKVKKVWNKPELTVLVRNRPEEAVLTGCHQAGTGGGPGNSNQESSCVYAPQGKCQQLCYAPTVS